jgi:hypothetical protein
MFAFEDDVNQQRCSFAGTGGTASLAFADIDVSKRYAFYARGLTSVTVSGCNVTLAESC